MTTAPARTWTGCPYCREEVEILTDDDALNHLIDEHTPQLIAEKPLILRRPRVGAGS